MVEQRAVHVGGQYFLEHGRGALLGILDGQLPALRLAHLGVERLALDFQVLARALGTGHGLQQDRDLGVGAGENAALDDLGVSAAKAKPMKVVRKVYADVDQKLWPAAKMSVKTQLEYLRTL